MADIKTTEEIGLELMKRKTDQAKTTAVRTSDVPEITAVDDEIDAELKARVHEILSSGILTNVDIAQIILPDPEDKKHPYAKFQFRRKRQNYEPLKRSIKEIGIIDPIVLKKESGVDGVIRYYILNGNTRHNILVELLKEDPTTLIPPFLVVECSDGDATLIATVLNSFSENLDGEDKPFAVLRMFEIGGVSQKEIARRLGYSANYVSEIIGGFLNVPIEAREMIESRKWTIEHGIQLARLKDEKDEQTRIFENAKRHRYAADKLQSTVNDSKERRKYQAAAEKKLKENLAKRKTKVVTSADMEKIHEDTVKEVYPYGSRQQIAKTYTKAALESIGFEVIEGDAQIEAKKESKSEKAKMPKNDELMEESYYKSVCPFCGGRTTKFIAEHFDFATETVYSPNGAIAHRRCDLLAKIAKMQSLLDKDSITKRIHEDPAGFSFVQMNKESHEIYNEELERRKQAWREEHLPEKMVKKGPHVGEPVEDTPKDELKILERLRKLRPKLIPKHYWDPIEKFMRQEEGYKTQQEAAEQISVSVQSFYVQLKKVRTAIAASEF